MVFVEDIAKVFSGISLRGSVSNDPDGEVAVYQLRDVNREALSLAESAVFLKRGGIRSRYLLRQGDLLFVSKGAQNEAVLFHKGEVPSVATSAFFVIRITDPKVKPCYLQWFINLEETQNYFKQHHGGTYTPAVRKSVLEKMPVSIPDLQVQEKICRIHELQNAEQEILRKMKEQRKLFVNAQLTQKIESTKYE